MINNIVLNGRLAFDNEVKQTNNGHAVISNRLAVERNYKDAQGNRDTDFINVVFWRQQAEVLNQYAKKGDLIGVQGRLQVRSYENQQGQRVEVVEVVVNELQFLQTKNSTQNQGNNNGFSGQNYNQGNSQGNNYNSGNQQNNGGFNMQDGTPVDISEDDLPF